MAPKKIPVKKTAKVEDDTSVSSEHSEPKKVTKRPTKSKKEKELTKTAKTKAEVEPERTTNVKQTTEETAKGWENVSNSDDDVNLNDSTRHHNDDSGESSLSDNDNTERKRVAYNTRPDKGQKNFKKAAKHVTNSAINFNYNQYRQPESSLKDMATPEVLKLLIVRAHDDGQSQLCDTLKQTLRAMHFECNFPVTDNSHPKRDDSHRQFAYSRDRDQRPPRFTNNQANSNSQQNFKPGPRFGNRPYRSDDHKNQMRDL
jgi:hypothetical protein